MPACVRRLLAASAVLLALLAPPRAKAAAVTWAGVPVPVSAVGTVTWTFAPSVPPATMSVAAAGAASLTWSIQCQDGNAVWQAVAMFSVADPATPVTSATGDGFYVANVGSFGTCRVDVSVYTSGTETFALGGSQAVLVPIFARST